MNIGKRRRNITWKPETDAIAVQLAHERGCKDGVSELLEHLVLEERERPRLKLQDPSPGYEAHIRQSEASSDILLKKDRKFKE